MGFGAGCLERCVARVFSQTLGSTREGHPAVLSVALGVSGRKGCWVVALGDSPGGAGVGQAHRDEAAQVQSGSSVVQPVIVFGGAAVAEFAVVAGQPCDRTFDHGPVLSVFGLPGRLTRQSAGAT